MEKTGKERRGMTEKYQVATSTIFEKKRDAQKVREGGREEKKERKKIKEEWIEQGGHGSWGDIIRWSGKGNG